MSYTENYSATISGVEHKTVDYPASENGGSMTVSVHWSEDVDIAIHVDTSSFDHSVSTIKHHIDGLTTAVVATEAAQIAERSRSAEEIGQSVTSGFFRLIGSEIAQQMLTLKSKVDSQFLKLNDMKSACQRIQQNMQQDYHRITGRYEGIFEELDRELARRITSLDEATYKFVHEATQQRRRSFDSTLSTVPTVFGRENSQAQSLLLAGSLRSRMNSLLQCAVTYLSSEKRTSVAVSTMLEADNSGDSDAASVPVVYLAADGTAPHPGEEVMFPPAPEIFKNDGEMTRTILRQFRQESLTWKPLPSHSKAQIERFFLPMVEGIHSSSDEQDARTRQTILRLWNSHPPQVLPF